MLNDREIEYNVAAGKIISENYSRDSLTPNGYDIRIGDYELDIIKTNSLFFISSLEKFNMPDNIVASLHIKSKYARRGVFASFGFVDAGFIGNLTMAFYNFGDGFQIKRGMKFVQIVFYEIKTPDKNYPGRSGNYQNSEGINVKSPED